MGYPASVATVVVTATYQYSDGNTTAPSGSVTFTPNTPLLDAADSRILDVRPLTVGLDVTGHITATLMATDDTHLAPTGWAYTVTELIGGNTRTYTALFPQAVTPVDLSTVAPATSTPMFAYILTTAAGAPLGVATLDVTGNVPLAQLGNAPSGGGGTSVVVVDNGFTTAGNITATSGSWTQLGTDIVIAAATGDHLEIQVEALANSTPNFITIDVATQVSGADTNWASTGTNTSRYPGSIPPWTLPASNFFGTLGPVGYVVQSGDIVTGNVTLRCYARTDASTRDVLATATFPFRWRVLNYGH